MYGTITFDSIKQLAEFLRSFTGSTAKFTVVEVKGQWVLEFTGGY